MRGTTTTTGSINGMHRSMPEGNSLLACTASAELIPRLKIPANLKFADPAFRRPAHTDILHGAGPTLTLCSVRQINLTPPQGPHLGLQNTLLSSTSWGNREPSTSTEIQLSINRCHRTFQWLNDSKHSPTSRDNIAISKNCYLSRFEFDMKQFWKIEEGPHFSIEERTYEQHFQQDVH
ncbi:hypothetical protein ANTPLA_LOCUS2921 [Anthophora plagiata]